MEKPRILFVEDERTLRDHLVQALSNEYVVDEAGDGEEALRAILRARPEIIVTEIFMPGIDGIELVRTLRNTPSTATIPNSAKYTDRGGAIALQLKRSDQHVIVTVTDDGIGIAPESLEHVFEMFSQVNPKEARTDGGLGIGLALVRMLVEMHDGSVSASSAGMHRGSTFAVTLPLAAVGSASAMGDGTSASRFGGGAAKRVLVVDDNVDAAASLAMLLGMGGHEVRTASDGIEAVEAARTFSPQIVFHGSGDATHGWPRSEPAGP